MSNRGLLQELIQSLCCLPGVGPKSAQRMAFYLLQRNRAGGLHLSRALAQALTDIKHCRVCQTLSETELCAVCDDQRRDPGLLCVVESPADAWLIEQATAYKGYYFVLNGKLSPLDGVGPAQLGLDKLETRLQTGAVKEIILATNATVESQATAHFIGEIAAKWQVRATRIAHGVPFGGELEFIDSNTLTHAFNDRREF